MSGRVEDRVHVGLLDHLTGIEYRDLFAGFCDDAEIVCDHDDRGIVALAQIVHQVQDLGLYGHVQRGGGFVGDEQARVIDERDGDHHALQHAAGEVMGIILEDLRRTGDFDSLEHFQRGVVHLRTCSDRMKSRVSRICSSMVYIGIKRGHRFLKNHGDVLAAQFAQLGFGQGPVSST